MDTIRNYLDNMFSAFPNTAEVNNIKENLLSSMEDKYIELKNCGKSENEAIGIVISEFGNIDELANELGFQKTDIDVEPALPVIHKEVVDQFLSTQKSYGGLIAFGVFLCIMSPATFILFYSLSELRGLSPRTSNLALFPLFILIAIAVSLFIFSGFQLDKYDNLKEPFQLDYGLKEMIENKKNAYLPSFTVQVIIGVVLCILSPLIILFTDIAFGSDSLVGDFSVSVLLCFIAVAVFLFVRADMILDGYKVLLQEKEFSIDSKKQEKKLQAISSVFWSLVTALYLLWSFLSGDWGITWIIWPITAILYGAFASVFKMIHSRHS